MANDTKIKICGLRTLESVQVASENGADFIGLVFYPKSPRYITPEATDELVAAIAKLKKRPQIVGLFVNASLAELTAATERYGLDYLQLSGDETPEQVQEAARLRPIFKSVRLPEATGVAEALESVAAFGDLPNVTLLLDTAKKGMYGGTGETGDWQIAASIAARYRILLAGGLHPENVQEAVAQVQPWGVDVSSGVESAPGIKDLEKIKNFCRQARR